MKFGVRNGCLAQGSCMQVNLTVLAVASRWAVDVAREVAQSRIVCHPCLFFRVSLNARCAVVSIIVFIRLGPLTTAGCIIN